MCGGREKRNSNFELLRILCCLAVITEHFCERSAMGGLTYAELGGWEEYICWIIVVLGTFALCMIIDIVIRLASSPLNKVWKNTKIYRFSLTATINREENKR